VSDVKLLATDLDGTLIGNANEFHLYEDFGDHLAEYKKRYGTTWVACTGRSLRSFLHFITPMQTMGLTPEFVIIKHAYIYRMTRFGYRPHYAWNFFIRYHIWSSRLYMREALSSWHKMITGLSEGVTTVYHRSNRLCLRFSSEEAAEAAAKLLRDKAKVFRHLKVFQYLQEVDIRTVPFTKGLALGELCDRLGVSPVHVLAIGNGHNDISMLDGSVAKMTGCPENAEIDVMDVVRGVNGHIASKKVLAGVIEVMDAYRDNKVSSELPEWWTPNKRQRNPRSLHRAMNHPSKKAKHRRPQVAAGWLAVLIAYAVLLVFASFGLIPFSGRILKPFAVLSEVMQKILDWFV
jgi:hydroxymethylpyrimidine pyrophosphatase-like HAD family hydrolase